MAEEILVHMRHIREARFCRGGFKDYCAAHGLDWRRIGEGVPVSELRRLSDGLANRVCDLAEAEASRTETGP